MGERTKRRLGPYHLVPFGDFGPRGHLGVRLIFYQLSEVWKLCLSSSKTSQVPAAFIVNSRTRVMDRQRTWSGFIKNNPLQFRESTVTSLRAPTRVKCFLVGGNIPTNVELFIPSIPCSFCKKHGTPSRRFFYFYSQSNATSYTQFPSIPFYRHAFCWTVSKCMFKY